MSAEVFTEMAVADEFNDKSYSQHSTQHRGHRYLGWRTSLDPDMSAHRHLKTGGPISIV